MATRVLIGSPVRQKPNKLECFLRSLKALHKNGVNIAYFFIDDNVDAQASRLLEEFAENNPDHILVEKGKLEEAPFVCDEVTHRWTGELVWKVASYKNRIIDYATREGFDYLFLVDSDLVLHPKTLCELLNAGKEILSEIFWTKWKPDLPELPQVWACDHYTLYEISPGEVVAPEVAWVRQEQWLSKLRQPGIYKVGGLGACTLISRRVLEKGVNFGPLYNLSFWGEDRHFCVRAVACGFELFVDTHYPAFHIYRDSDLPAAYTYMREHGIIEGTTPSESPSAGLLEVARRALETYGTTACYQDDLHAGLEYFIPEIREQIFEERANLHSKVRKGEIVTYAEVLTVRAEEIADHSATVLAEVRNFGIEGGRNFLDEFTATVELRNQGGCWMVAGVNPSSSESDAGRAFRQAPWAHRIAKRNGNRITLAMIARNEADRYLGYVLEQARRIVDAAVIIDDGSTDGTPDLIEKALGDRPLVLIRNGKSLFEHNESELRQLLWHETIKTNPDWILCLDADELFEERAVEEIKEMVNQPDFDFYAFRIYDFWDEVHYREDDLWMAHLQYWVLLVRYQPYYTYVWNEKPLHSGRFPANVAMLPGIQSPLRVKHLGWMNPLDRLKKYLRYRQLDPEGAWGIKEQYESILDPRPHLIRWQD